ncbi:MAG: phage holin family protein [Pseudomonadota bacterium]|nr:phage holin family protein [Pseudomonadota bacterium]
MFQDIVHNIQDMVRAEMRLAKTEVRDEIVEAKSGLLALGIGTLSAMFALFFILLAAVYGLSDVLPPWAASLLVAVGLTLCAALAISLGMKGLKRVRAAPKTIQSLQENVEWAKQPTK